MSEIRVKITFNEKDRSKTFIETDVRPQVVEEVLSAFIQGQIGEGEDRSEANIRDVYVIDIFLELADDSFRVVSDTGNKGLTCGIVMAVMSTLEGTDIRPLA